MLSVRVNRVGLAQRLFCNAQDTQKYVCSIAGYSTIQSTITQGRAGVAQLPSV
jgi:hypothetical protein